MKQVLVPIVLAGALIGWFAPGERPAAVPGQGDPGEAASAAEPARVNSLTGWYGSEVSLEREADGHFYATVSGQAGDVRMLVDTGASVVALTGGDAADMGLLWDPNAVGVIGRGAGGDVMGVPTVIPQLRLGEFEMHDVEAVIIPEGLDISLLGQSFLGQLSRVEIRDDRMVLGN